MAELQTTLIACWGESSRHDELVGFLKAAHRLIAQAIPHERIIALEVSGAGGALEELAFVADSNEEPDAAGASGPLEFTASEWKTVVSWLRRDDSRKPASLLPPPCLTRHAADRGWGEQPLLLPLTGDGKSLGLCVLVPFRGQAFSPQHRQGARQLAAPIAAALENDRRRREIDALRASADADRASLLMRLGRPNMSETIIGAEKGLRFVMERVEIVAESDAPVLILGDTGSGKEVIARAIHERSPRHAAPFIRVNCGAIPPELIDSQLFGHEKGSFTGAAEQRLGWFERADGGTLFLDEVGELPLPAQVRLLRVLQDHFFERVGGQQSVHVNVRIVAATHRDLAEMVNQGTFRQDLWYRINVFPILLPRLADRREDIPDLVRHFARRAANRFGLPYVEPTAADLLALEQYEWPGNVRELAAVIDRASILGRGKSLDVVTSLGWTDQRTPAQRSGGSSTGGKGVAGKAHAQAASDSRLPSLNEAIATHIQRALAAARGRIEGPKGAAALLDVNPHTLRAKMRKLGLDWSKYRD